MICVVTIWCWLPIYHLMHLMHQGVNSLDAPCTMYCRYLCMKSGVICPRGSHCKSCLPTSKLGCVQHTDPILAILGELFYFNIEIVAYRVGGSRTTTQK